MRIIAGKYRGRVLSEFRGMEIRPTPDRVKESLFQILAPRLVHARVLDLFCGSGALGLESLSRGAASAAFNDASQESVRLVKKNLQALKAEGEVTCLDFRVCLSRAALPYDLIFCDPPYREAYAAEIMGLAASCGALRSGGLLIYESEREEAPSEGWSVADFRSYGRTKITMFERSGV